MEKALFVLPSYYCSNGKTPIEYRLEFRNCDRRTRFFKKYALAKCTEKMANHLLRYCNQKGDRLIVCNGKDAFRLYRWLLKEGWKA